MSRAILSNPPDLEVEVVCLPGSGPSVRCAIRTHFGGPLSLFPSIVGPIDYQAKLHLSRTPAEKDMTKFEVNGNVLLSRGSCQVRGSH